MHALRRQKHEGQVTMDDVIYLPPTSDLRKWADNPAASGFVPIHPGTLRALADEIDRLKRHDARSRRTLSVELGIALNEWKDAGAPVERVVSAVGNMLQSAVDFVIAEFDEEESPHSAESESAE